MPGNDFSPTIAISSGFDARAWTGAQLFSRDLGAGAQTVTNSTYASGEGIYDDILSFVNARGVADTRTLENDIQANWTGANPGSCRVSITTSDLLEIRHLAAGGPVVFDVAASGNNTAWGFPAAGLTSTTEAGTGDEVALATTQWVRGNVINVPLSIDPTGAPAAFALPFVPFRTESVITALRDGYGNEGDADDFVTATFTGLEEQDNNDTGVAAKSTRWGVNSSGHVWWAGDTSILLGNGLVWISTTLRDRLGFTGDESVSTVSGLDFSVADNPCPGLLVPSRPMEDQQRWGDEESEVVRKSDGNLHGTTTLDYQGWDVEFRVGGPADVIDEHRHFLEHVLPYMPIGSRVTVYQQWGDPRRAVEDRPASGTSYTVLNTPELNGYRGRLRLRRSGDDSTKKQAAWENRIRQRFLVGMTLEDAVD